MVVANLFCTITNANFDDDNLAQRVRNTCAAKKALIGELGSTDGLADAALWEAVDKDAMHKMIYCVRLLTRWPPTLIIYWPNYPDKLR